MGEGFRVCLNLFEGLVTVHVIGFQSVESEIPTVAEMNLPKVLMQLDLEPVPTHHAPPDHPSKELKPFQYTFLPVLRGQTHGLIQASLAVIGEREEWQDPFFPQLLTQVVDYLAEGTSGIFSTLIGQVDFEGGF